MADDDGEQPEGDEDEVDEASLPDDAKRLLKHIGRTTRRELNSVLDERLRVEAGTGEGKDGNGKGEGDGAGDGAGGGSQETPGQSLAQRLGFGG